MILIVINSSCFVTITITVITIVNIITLLLGQIRRGKRKLQKVTTAPEPFGFSEVIGQA